MFTFGPVYIAFQFRTWLYASVCLFDVEFSLIDDQKIQSPSNNN